MKGRKREPVFFEDFHEPVNRRCQEWMDWNFPTDEELPAVLRVLESSDGQALLAYLGRATSFYAPWPADDFSLGRQSVYKVLKAIRLRIERENP